MTARRLLAPVVALLLAPLALGSECDRRDDGGGAITIVDPAEDESPPPPAGSTCTGSCPRGQVCVGGVCRYLRASATGELLATSAAAQLELGDVDGALESYDRAAEAYRAAETEVPPEVLCGAALAALRHAGAGDREAREAAAARSDACFRASLPGYGLRREVQAALSRLRFDGLDVGAFDEPEPPTRFFSQEPTRPTTDAVEIAISFGESEESGFTELSQRLRDEASQRIISECFATEWQRTHERTLRADLLLKFRTRLRDMGDYDLYEPQIEIVPASGETPASAFATCIATGLNAATVEDLPRFRRQISPWQEPFEVGVRVQ
jgi:hypothetical protein